MPLSYIFFFFFSKLDLVILFQKTIPLALILQGSLGNRWTILFPFRKLRLQFHFMAWYPVITHPYSLNIFNHECVCLCVYVCE